MTRQPPPTHLADDRQADWQLVKHGHAVYATRDGRYEVRNRFATALDQDWLILEHPAGDDDPAKYKFYGPFKSLTLATSFILRRYARPLIEG